MRNQFIGYLVVICLLISTIAALAAPEQLNQALELLKNHEASNQQLEQIASLLETAATNASVAEERDESVLLLGLCYDWLNQPDRAIPRLEALAARNPDLKMSFPDQGIWDISSLNTLGYLYKDKGDWQKAIDAWERYLEINPDKRITAHRILGNLANARRQLAAAKKSPSSAIVIARGHYLGRDTDTAKGYLLVRASELAQALKLQHKFNSRTKSLTLSSDKKTLVLTVSGASSGENGDIISLPAKPKQQGRDMLVPLRPIAEYFGAHIKWEEPAGIAWVS